MSRRITIDAREKLSDFPILGELYDIVAGKADGATVQVNPAQMKAVYFLLAGPKEWLEPLSIPADYRLSNVKFEVVE